MLKTKVKRTIRRSPKSGAVLTDVLHEIRLLRQEISLFLPMEKLEDYHQPNIIIDAYREALTQYPPRS